MCATCVAQGAAYLVPAYAVVKTQSWRRRRRQRPDGAEPADEQVRRAPAERVVSRA